MTVGVSRILAGVALLSFAALFAVSRFAHGTAAWCDYSGPEYSAEEIAAVGDYHACIAAATAYAAEAGPATAELEALAGKPENAKKQPADCIDVHFAGGPTRNYCFSIAEEAPSCAVRDVFQPFGNEKAFSCADLTSRHKPDFGKLVELTKKRQAASERDQQERIKLWAACKHDHAKGEALVNGSCRKVHSDPGLK
jgi:hypothetical protein